MASMTSSPTFSNGPYQPHSPQGMANGPTMPQGPPPQMNSPPRRPQAITPQSHVGFDTITQQIERKLLKRGFQFNVICVGAYMYFILAGLHLLTILQVKVG